MSVSDNARDEFADRIGRNELRDRAIELAISTDLSNRKISERLGISHTIVNRWIEEDNAEFREQQTEKLERYRRKQRKICYAILEKWEPLATAEHLSIQKHDRTGEPYIDEDAYDESIKAAAVVLKTLERLAKLDGLDAAERKELVIEDSRASLVELAERVKSVTPLLQARLSGRAVPAAEAAV